MLIDISFNFQASTEFFCLRVEKLAKLILELCTLRLGLVANNFSQHMNSNQSIAQLNYYPTNPNTISYLV